MERYTRIRCIGSGTFGEAFLVHDHSKQQQIVLKDVKVGILSPTARQNALNEVNVLASLRHPYIVRYFDSFVADNELHIAMEYCPKGDLHHCIEQQRLTGSLFPQEQVLAWATQLLLALDYLHQGKVLHRDLKSQNVFISRRNHLKLGDFGVSLCLESTDQFAHTLVGTPYYLSPELAGGRPYNSKSDCWAAGCVLYEMLTLQHAFDACNISLLLIRINAGHYPSPSSSYDVRLRAYLRKLLTTNPTLRWSCEEMLVTDLFRPYVARYARAARPELLSKLELPNNRAEQQIPTPSQLQPPLPYQQQQVVQKAGSTTSSLHSGEPSNSDNIRVESIEHAETGYDEVWIPISTLQSTLPARASTFESSADWLLVSTPLVTLDTTKETEETDVADKHAAYQAQAAVAKFMLGSKTLHLEAEDNATSHDRIEALRAYLEDHVGDEVTVQAHGMIEAMVYQDADQGGPSFADIKQLLGDKGMYLPLVVQLVHAEAFHFAKDHSISVL